MNLDKVKRLCLRFSDAVSGFKNNESEIKTAAGLSKAKIYETHMSECRRIASEFNISEMQCSEETRRRQAVLKNALDSVNRELDGIKDPHWHRMKHKNYKKAVRETDTNYVNLSSEELFHELDELLENLYRETLRLQNAFIPSGMANAIGAMVHPYRKKQYLAIAVLREKILSCAKAISALPDIKVRLEIAESHKAAGAAEIERKTAERLSALADSKRKAEDENKKALFDAANALVCEGILSKNKIPVGNFIFEDPGYEVIRHLPSEFAKYLTKEGLSFPISVSDFDKNVLFVTDGKASMSKAFGSVAADILSFDSDARIMFSDVQCMGASYSFLAKLEAAGCITVWRTEEELLCGLKSICADISETYRSVLGDTYKNLREYNAAPGTPKKSPAYIFIDGLSGISENAKELLGRIIKNGNPAGVFALMSIDKSTRIFQGENGFFKALSDCADFIKVSSGDIVISEYAKIHPVNSAEGGRIEAICQKSTAMLRKQSVLPLGAVLPAPEQWQKKSSADGIEITVGIDQNGKEQKLLFSEEKPYALIIGDVGSGKSSLLHSIIIQTMANYSDSEVKIAVGDFKGGAEFNVYAAARLKSADAVIDNEDSDVMTSFLRYYVAEMRNRQRLFEQLEAKTHTLIRKYEVYRAVLERFDRKTAKMPRILIVIDEYQSLFENVFGTAAMLNELVRKGRTYGIHLVMASQRAACDSPKNSFTGDLKNYFTTRFVFKAPQAAARTMLSERCADTNRENSGIAKAALLKKGCAIYNSYMGQTERDNRELQCFYASDSLITDVCRVLSVLNGSGSCVLLRGNEASAPAPPGSQSKIILGTSPCLRCDAFCDSADDICDNTLVSIKASQYERNIICSGSDERIFASVVKSAVNHFAAFPSAFEVHVFGKGSQAEYRRLFGDNAFFHKAEQEVKNELARQTECTVPCINLFTEITDYPIFSQSLRASPESELFRQFLSGASSVRLINIICAKSFRNIRSSFGYIPGSAAIYILGAGETENIRSATSDGFRITNSDFDFRKKDAINAYYYNRNTDKFGKVILYKP